MLIKRMSVLVVAAVIVLFPYGNARAIETMAEYTDTPIFMSNTVTPNILILLSTSETMNNMAYPDNGSFAASSYYGYYLSKKYSYAAKFTADGAGSWDGDFLNWITMRRIDVARKVLVGGKATSRITGPTQENIGENSGSDWDVCKWGADADKGNSLVPSSTDFGVEMAGAEYAYVLDGGNFKIWVDDLDLLTVGVFETTPERGGDCTTYLQDNGQPSSSGQWVDGNSYNIKVEHDSTIEPELFFTNPATGNYALAGVIQKVSAEARWGLEVYNTGPGGGVEGANPRKDGGNIVQPITGTGYGVNMITGLSDTAANTKQPLAEALLTAAGYFAQDEGGTVYSEGTYTNNVQGKDPFYFGDLATPQYVKCPNNFVLIITDGGSTWDSNIDATPQAGYTNNCQGGSLQDCDGDGNEAVLPAAGDNYKSDYLDDVALWAHTTDLRPSMLDGDQNITVYVVHAFGTDPDDITLLKETAKNGAFIDSDDNNLPTVDGEPLNNTEWDEDGDGIPDTYFSASDGNELEEKLLESINDILQKATSGTAISVLATSSSGAGNIFQAYFLPSQTILETVADVSVVREVTWLGHLLSLNIDANGSLRDNTDTCIKFYFDSDASETYIQTVPEVNGVCDTSGAGSGGTALTSYNGYVWDAGEILLTKDASTRTIYTFMDTDEDGLPGMGEFISFDDTSAAALQKYLRTSTAAESADVINFIRGSDISGYRDRTIEDGGTDYEWKLGDIVHSTPSVVADPAEAFGLIYQDTSYTTFFNTNKGRNAAVYVGANDGMLHAFCAENAGCGAVANGSELWAYIPYNLLPHLKWLTDPDYTHVNYVDFKMKTSDVKIGGTWKTILIGGMRTGGGQISDETYDVDGDGDNPVANLRYWESAYFAIDITDPAAPNLLWEFTDPDLSFTMSYPTIAKVGTKWYAVFGSGPQSTYVPDYEGNPDHAAKLFVVDMDDGSLDATFTVDDSVSFFADPVAVDIDFVSTDGTDYSVDAIYVGETYYKSTGGGYWSSRMWRLVTFGDSNPANWKMYNLFNADNGEQIVAAPSLASDELGQQWIYFGTGKYYSDSDKTTTDGQSFYAMKDPCWNPDVTNYGWKGPIDAAPGTCTSGSDVATASPTASVSKGDLINSTSVVVELGGAIQGGSVAGALNGDSVDNLSDEIVDDSVGNTLAGWYVDLPVSGERSLNKPTVAGGLVLFTTFVPSSDLCGYSGDSYFNVLFFTTGTAYKESIIGCASGDDDCSGASPTVLSRSEESATGMASSIAIHMGRETGAQAYVQLSTGEAAAINLETLSGSTSGIISWRDL